MTPQRIQRKGTKGWRMPENTRYVGSGTRWGNPWRASELTVLTGKRRGQKATVEDVVRIFRHNFEMSDKLVALAQEQLRGKDLACWCRLDQPCHADVLLDVANRPQGEVA